MVKISEFPKAVEPLMSSRFIIKFNEEVTIPEYLFRNFKIYNEGESLIFRTEMYQTVNYSFNPSDLFKMTSVTIHYLDPVGEVVNGINFNLKGSNLVYKNDYRDDGLSILKFQFVIDVESMKLIYQNS